MQFANIDGHVIHFQQIGAAKSKPTLVFVNPLGSDFRVWRDIIVQLAGDFAMLTYDKRGHGLSDRGGQMMVMEDHVWDLANLLDHVGIQQAFVCGLSIGGMIAQGLAVARPEMVQGLILCDTGHKIGTAKTWQERIEAVEDEGPEAVADAVIARWFTDEFKDAHAAEVRGFRNMIARQDTYGYIQSCNALAEADLTHVAPEIEAPTLLLCGDQDEVTSPALMHELQGMISGARLELIEGAAHVPAIEKPHVMADFIRNYAREMVLETE
ncbi:MAG: 3-oxoadipate enol-lactonase [Hyphomicrobiaceae bacterium]|nr:3-oxoadipate enol-lactonase [Hyphomicrobiaceae bacterium]MCC0024755.1 3-oxoadipate enol-lactonase [Hyphomicrobiaceae bacterium]